MTQRHQHRESREVRREKAFPTATSAEGKVAPVRAGAPRQAVGFREHLAFFDEDGDGAITQQETKRGLEKLGLGRILSVPGAVLVNVGVAGLARAQRQRIYPWRLPIADAGFVRHPDTQLVDGVGNFQPARLDAVFARYGKRCHGKALCLSEIVTMSVDRTLRARRSRSHTLLVPAGIAATLVEWVTLWWMAKTPREDREVLEKSDVVRFYTDARFFYDVAKRISAAREQRSRTSRGRARNALQTWLL